MTQDYTADTPRNRGGMSAPHLSPATPSEDARTILINKISWGAVLAGVVLTLVVQLLINMLGIGVGAATLNPGTADNPSAAAFSVGAGLWFLISGILASLAGGYAAGRLAGGPKESTAGWHGLTTWALSTLLIFYLLTSSIGGILGGAYSTVTSALGSVASTAGATAQTAVNAAAPGLANLADPFSSIEQSVRSATGGNDPAALRDTAINAMRAVITGDEAQVADAREQAAQALATAKQEPIEQARTEVGQYEQQYRQAVATAKQKATETANAAAKAVSRGALFGALGLILGAVAAFFGGRYGAVAPTLTGRLLGVRSATTATTTTRA